MQKKIASLLSEMATASYARQKQIVAEVDALRSAEARRISAESSLDFGSMDEPIKTPFQRHGVSTDWLDLDDGEADLEEATQVMSAKASSWFNKTSEAVRRNPREFLVQAEGAARFHAADFSPHNAAAARSFMDYVKFLNRANLGDRTASAGSEPERLMPRGSRKTASPINGIDCSDGWAPNRGESAMDWTICEVCGSDVRILQGATSVYDHELGQDVWLLPVHLLPGKTLDDRTRAYHSSRSRKQASDPISRYDLIEVTEDNLDYPEDQRGSRDLLALQLDGQFVGWFYTPGDAAEAVGNNLAAREPIRAVPSGNYFSGQRWVFQREGSRRQATENRIDGEVRTLEDAAPRGWPEDTEHIKFIDVGEDELSDLLGRTKEANSTHDLIYAPWGSIKNHWKTTLDDGRRMVMVNGGGKGAMLVPWIGPEGEPKSASHRIPTAPWLHMPVTADSIENKIEGPVRTLNNPDDREWPDAQGVAEDDDIFGRPLESTSGRKLSAEAFTNGKVSPAARDAYVAQNPSMADAFDKIEGGYVMRAYESQIAMARAMGRGIASGRGQDAHEFDVDVSSQASRRTAARGITIIDLAEQLGVDPVDLYVIADAYDGGESFFTGESDGRVFWPAPGVLGDSEYDNYYLTADGIEALTEQIRVTSYHQGFS